jgi:3-methyladenine DNA glycosylase/8-oxoguanine DNA glycosylase
MIAREFGSPRDLAAMLGVLSRGSGDPAYRREQGGVVWLTGLGPDGPVSLRLSPGSAGVGAQFWGEGAQWAADHVDDLLGGKDDPSGFVPVHPLIERQWRRYRDTLRVPRTLLTWQVALAAVLEQRVTGVEARGAWRALVSDHGAPAPGPVPERMRVPPSPDEVLRVPSWDWRRYGVDRQRIATIRELARCAHLLVRAEDLPPAEGRDLLTRIPGVGPWTAAEISARAFGDADAVSVGDYHLARNVTFALTGRTDGTDEDMLGLLAPYAGHRHRAVRLIELSGSAPARRGPRMRLPGPGA